MALIKRRTITSFSKDMEKFKPSNITYKNIKWCSCSGKVCKYLKKFKLRGAGRVAQVVELLQAQYPEFNPEHHQKRKRKKKLKLRVSI
jgi:acetone carboxylase gamma subunit